MPFEIKKPEMTSRTFRLPLLLLQRLETIAQQKGISVNNLVAQCCEYALNDLIDEEK